MSWTRATNLGILLAIASGCGVSQEAFVTKQNELTRCQRDLNRSQADTLQARAHTEELERIGEQLRERANTLENDHSRLEAGLSANASELSELRRAHAAQERRLAAFRALEDRLRAQIDAHQITVERRHGKMVLRLAEATLFDPGKNTLKASADALLHDIASALKEIPERDFLVAGHTDNSVVIAKGGMKSNWELSTSRAVAVVRSLQAEGVDPRHLAAAGYSEFDGIGENDTPEGRAQNRRIEIVVQPTAEELPASAPPKPNGEAPPRAQPEPRTP